LPDSGVKAFREALGRVGSDVSHQITSAPESVPCLDSIAARKIRSQEIAAYPFFVS